MDLSVLEVEYARLRGSGPSLAQGVEEGEAMSNEGFAAQSLVSVWPSQAGALSHVETRSLLSSPILQATQASPPKKPDIGLSMHHEAVEADSIVCSPVLESKKFTLEPSGGFTQWQPW